MVEDSPSAADVYDRRTILLHWLMAALIVLQWVGGRLIDVFPIGPLRVDARSVHVVFGIGLIAVFLVRIGWRRSGGRILAPFSNSIVDRIAKAAHGMLYILVAAVLAMGVINAWVRGDTIFGLFQISSIAPGDQILRLQVAKIHEWLAHTLIAAAILHALGGLAHSFATGERVLARMRLRASSGERSTTDNT